MADVDFVINCYERTYRDVLQPGFMAARVAEQRFSFASVTVLVNNVNDDRGDAERLAKELLAADPVVSRVEFVEDHIAAAFAKTGLSARRIRRLPHFTDCCLVALTLPGPDWLVYWDADGRLREAADWISPMIAYMEHHPEIAVGNPNNWHEGLAEREALEVDGDVAVGYGFSDVAFLVRRSEFARPIYRKICPASWRYPLAHVEAIFEQRADAYMRRTGQTRATYLPVVVTHEAEAGVNYPAGGLRERARRKALTLADRALSQASHPAVRAWR